MKVKITVKPKQDIWYKHRVGEVFECKPEYDTNNNKPALMLYNDNIRYSLALWLNFEHIEILECTKKEKIWILKNNVNIENGFGNIKKGLKSTKKELT